MSFVFLFFHFLSLIPPQTVVLYLVESITCNIYMYVYNLEAFLLEPSFVLLLSVLVNHWHGKKADWKRVYVTQRDLPRDDKTISWSLCWKSVTIQYFPLSISLT